MRSWLMVVVLGAAALVPADASAFGGAYVGPEGVTATNRFGHIVYTRLGQRSVVTLAPDVSVASDTFGLVLPVPGAVAAEDVGTVQANVIAALDAYSAPRLLSYTCEDLEPWREETGYDPYEYYYWDYDWYEENQRARPLFGTNWGAGPFGQCGAIGCGRNRRNDRPYYGYGYDRWETGAVPPDEPSEADPSVVGVAVEASFAAGVYDVTVLTAEESGGLVEWLTQAGFAVEPGAEAAFDAYVQLGWRFVVARVSLDAAPEDGALLPPLQIAYDTEAMVLPLRVGTASAAGPQDVVVHVLNDRSLGRAGVVNYPLTVVGEACMTAPDAATFASWYEGYADLAIEAAAADPASVAGWAHEFSWAGGGCDPCGPSGALPAVVATAFGWDTDLSLLHVTRLRLHYTAAGLDQDPVLVSTGSAPDVSLEFVQYAEELESDFKVCGEDWPDDPGSCADTRARTDGPRPRRIPLQGSLAGTAALLVGALAWRRRSR